MTAVVSVIVGNFAPGSSWAQTHPAQATSTMVVAAGRGAPAPASSGPSAASVLASPSVAPPDSVPAPDRAAAPPTVKVYGHGLGPGWGMGQWGAYGYASLPAYHWTYHQIVDHYYGGSHLVAVVASVESAPVAVDLSEIDGASSTVLAANRRGSYLTVNGAKRWGTRTISHTGRTITVKASAGDVRVDLAGTWRAYQGSIVIQPGGHTWNLVPLEEYVAGVVPIEASAGWGTTGGEAALQAQAVAVRSYVVSYLYAVGHTCDTSYCQVYEGDPGTNPDIGSYVRYSHEATRSTAGLVVCRVLATSCPRAKVVSTQYASSSGGFTSGGGSPGFPAVVDAGDAVRANPWHDWTVYLSVSAVEAAYPSVGSITALEVSKRNGDGQMRGRALTVRIKGRRGSTSVAAEQFATQFGLDSNWFRFSTQP